MTTIKARAFLTELANLPSILKKDAAARAAWKRLCRMFEPVLASLWDINQTVLSGGDQLGVNSVLGGIALGNPAAGATDSLAVMLRDAWGKPTREEREAWILGLVVEAARLCQRSKGSERAIVSEPIGGILLEAIHSADVMRVCLNPECPARYFIARRRSQKFCSDKCAEPAQRAYKRRWWNEHGVEWAKSRERAKRKKRRRKSK